MSFRSFARLGASLGFACLVLAGCHQASPPPQPVQQPPIASRPLPPRNPSRPTNGTPSSDPNLVLGNPSGANTDANNFLLSKAQYTLSYNHRNGTPNWVAWHVGQADFGDVKRRDDFHPEEKLSEEWQIRPSDYKNSGYDKGHLCPSADRTDTTENNSETFSMANMVPQTPELNRHVWEQFESYVRDLVQSGNEVFQIAGPAGNTGTIADGRVVVPQGCWKVVVVVPAGQGSLRHISAQTRVIAIAIPNAHDPQLETADWRKYRKTPRDIERAVHLDFFSNLPPQLKNVLEQKLDTGD